jgi:hypothetical protein
VVIIYGEGGWKMGKIRIENFFAPPLIKVENFLTPPVWIEKLKAMKQVCVSGKVRY